MQGNFSNTLVIVINCEKAVVGVMGGFSAGIEGAIPSHTGSHCCLHPYALPVQMEAGIWGAEHLESTQRRVQECHCQ